MDFTEAGIVSLYEDSLKKAEEKLSSLDIAEGRKPGAAGLNGWVFEQTIRYCLSQELRAVGYHPEIRDQVSLGGRARIDLLVGRAAIELKARGSFGDSDSKYSRYRKTVEERGWVYLYLTMQERYAPYRKATESTFGSEHSFFIDTKGDWARFVSAVTALQV